MGPASLRARDLMTTEVVTVPPDTPVTSLARLLADRGISVAPLCPVLRVAPLFELADLMLVCLVPRHVFTSCSAAGGSGTAAFSVGIWELPPSALPSGAAGLPVNATEVRWFGT